MKFLEISLKFPVEIAPFSEEVKFLYTTVEDTILYLLGKAKSFKSNRVHGQMITCVPMRESLRER